MLSALQNAFEQFEGVNVATGKIDTVSCPVDTIYKYSNPGEEAGTVVGVDLAT